MHSPDLTSQNIQKIKELFPNCVTEIQDEQGLLQQAIDFDQLKQELDHSIVEGPQERYQLSWPGKREALLTANAPIAKTLRPCPEESVAFDTTQNLFIEGDNLDALKLLQETYLGKVKMIYIDPPYNTGNDFIYKDNFSENNEEFLIRSNQKDQDNNKLEANTESNGRFHSDWLSMIYPRLKLARNLLSDDGVIFISIGDEEYDNVKKVCNEIFGEKNFIETFIWIKKTAPNNVVIGSVHEYILVYCKDSISVELFLLPRNKEKDKDYKNPDNDPRGRWKPDNLTAAAKGGRATPSLLYKIVNPNTGREHYPPEGRMWIVSYDVMMGKIQDGSIYWGKDGDGRPMNKRFLNETRNGLVAQTLLNDVGSNSSASKELNRLFDGYVVFETPKPISLIEHFIQISSNNNDMIMDFFAGASATAHAVIQQNAEDGGNRQFIMVQLPEICDENSEAFKAGYQTISDISKERIRRAGQKVLASECHENWNKDVGFRVLKIDSSNMNDIYYKPDQYDQANLQGLEENIKADRTPDDLLFQVLLDWGVDLTLPIKKQTIENKTIFFVDDNALIACFDKEITEDLVTQLTQFKPIRIVFRDDGFISDDVKINTEQIFKQLSPITEIRSI